MKYETNENYLYIKNSNGKTIYQEYPHHLFNDIDVYWEKYEYNDEDNGTTKMFFHTPLDKGETIIITKTISSQPLPGKII